MTNAANTPSLPSLPKRRVTTPGIMLTVLIALLPAIAVRAWFAGHAWLLMLLASCLVAILLETLVLRLRGRPVSLARLDGSVLITAVLLLLVLPAATPWWLAVTGTGFAVIVGKHMFGGLGQNIFNPVLVGYLGLLALFTMHLTSPAAMTLAGNQSLATVSLSLAIMAGGLLLLGRRIISWHIPLAVLLTTGLVFYVFTPALNSYLALLLVFFIATEPVTSPGTRRGKLVYGALIGLMSTALTFWLPYSVAIAATVLAANAVTPTIDQLIRHDRKRHQPQEGV